AGCCSCLRLWLAIPPFRPASRASSLVHSCALPFWCAARPPLLAMSRCLSRSIDANPRSSLAICSPLRAPRCRQVTAAATDVPSRRRPVEEKSSTVIERLRRGGCERDPGRAVPGPQRDQDSPFFPSRLHAQNG